MSHLRALQVYRASLMADSVRVAPRVRSRNWSRRAIAEWLAEELSRDQRIIVGIDHAFSFPKSYLDRYRLADWDSFLADFPTYWPTDQDHTYVEFFRAGNRRTGSADELRLTETWTSSATSVFRLDGQGAVGKATHAGIPWLARLRRQTGEHTHFWPYDGFEIPATRSVIAEVYPSLFRKRYSREDRTADEHDAYAVARWMKEMDAAGSLHRYFDPPLLPEQHDQARREGWILGVA